MRAPLLTLLTILTILVPASQATARPRRAPRCATRATTVAANRHLRLFRSGPPVDRTYYACNMSSGRVRRLAGSGGFAVEYFAQFFEISGWLASFSTMECLDADCRYDDRTVNVRNGHIVRRLRGNGSVEEHRLLRHGSFVVMVAVTEANGQQRYAVVAASRSGRMVLDEGPDIETNSLAANGSRVYWMHAGQPRSARVD